MGIGMGLMPESPIAKSRATRAASRQVNPNATNIPSNKKGKKKKTLKIKKNTYVQSYCRVIKR